MTYERTATVAEIEPMDHRYNKDLDQCLHHVTLCITRNLLMGMQFAHIDYWV